MTNIKIREMKRDDIPSVVNIHKKMLSGKYSAKMQYRIEELLNFSIKTSPKSCLVAEKEGKVIGFVVGSIKEWGFGVERSGWLELIIVDPKYMGQTVGNALGKSLINSFKKEGIKDVYTSVSWDSSDLISFFKSLGFDKSAFINLKLSDNCK
jgi:L-amino acid N-acyltransferase YncA